MVRDDICTNTLRLRSKEGKDRISTIMLEGFIQCDVQASQCMC